MVTLLYPIMMIIFVSMITMKMSLMISTKKKNNFEKMSPFECGFNPITNSRLPFSMRFFLISIIFLIFDIEIALLIPMIYTLHSSNLFTWIITSSLFFTILLVGLIHEWNQGALNWL